ncbi:MAG: alpha-L-fucosidase [bacterium]|nr:alpha-L-fucosidase [bacterium]
MIQFSKGLSIVILVFFSLVPVGVGEEIGYEPNWASLDRHPIPAWFQDAKFGIFVYWGLSAVPAYAPVGRYAEWYWYDQQTSPLGIDAKSGMETTAAFHQRVYGSDFGYQDFLPQFKAECFDPEAWAEMIQASGARYALLNAKHHDGFCLFQSGEANRSWSRAWNCVDAGPKRDVLGELTEVVRARGIKMGIYFSLYEWSNPLWLLDRELYIEKHLFPQFKDVVTRYQPELIFSDGEWDLSSAAWRSEELLAWLFNESPRGADVVINDRWGNDTRHRHGDYYTTEYTSGLEGIAKPWEENRGMGHSYGYNRMERAGDYKSAEELVLMLVDIVSRGGNLFLDIGPTADGRIPVIMEERLRQMGAWLAVYGEAIYGTRPWTNSRQWSEGALPQTTFGSQYMVAYDLQDWIEPKNEGQARIEAFFTRKGEALYAICPKWPGKTFVLKDQTLKTGALVTLLGVDTELAWENTKVGAVISMPEMGPGDLPAEYGFVLKMELGE